jgi:hypothetical protein
MLAKEQELVALDGNNDENQDGGVDPLIANEDK